MDLLSLVLSLRPLPHESSDEQPIWWARAAHSLLLKVIAQYNPGLAESLHETSVPEMGDQGTRGENIIRPFTVSTLIGSLSKNKIDVSHTYTLRLTTFRTDLTGIIWQASQDGQLAVGNTIELDHLPFSVENLQPCHGKLNQSGHSLWAGHASYQELGASLLLAREPAPRKISLQFTSPVTFKSGGKHVPIPLPGLVFGSLLERWNAYAPITFPDETKRFAEECLAISFYKLSSRSVPIKRGGLRMGGVGEITYSTVNYDRYWMSVIGTLAAFALYSGIGAGTTTGMGQCRSVELPAASSNPSP